jgi:anti-sigma factor ChrR (cupin superfamily)
MKNIINLFDDQNWEAAEEYPDGTKRKLLRDENGAKTALLKFPAGFKMAPHSHITTEQHFVLEGEYESNGQTFGVGSYQVFYPHEEHGPYESKSGALILVVWDPLVK